MSTGVSRVHESLLRGSHVASRRLTFWAGRHAFRVGLLLFVLLILAPGIATGQSPSTRSCNRSAFTGRVGPARPAVCRTHAGGTPGPRGRSGGRGAKGFTGLPGLTGPEGLQGLLGPAGVIGLTGAEGTPGLKGTAGVIGLTGAEGTPGTPGVEGARGFAGLIGPEGPAGPRGFAGLPGPAGPAGPAGAEGPKGSTGATGSAGPAGAEGAKGSTGAPGSSGAEGARGPVGPEGPLALPVYAEFYALMPPDNAATVAAGTAVEFPQTGPTAGGIARRNTSEFVLPSVGTYRVSFSVSVSEPGQLVIALESGGGGGMVELPNTVLGRATGTSLISGEALVRTVTPNSAIELRSPTGNTPALTITPKAGGTHAAAASFVIQQIG
jgi:collagen triple helix repeat protein